MKKSIKVTAVAAAMTIAMAATAFAAPFAFTGTWQGGTGANVNRWWYAKDAAKTTWYAGTTTMPYWVWIDGNKDGVAECYAFDAQGWMYQNTTTPDNYTVNVNGAWTVNGYVQTQASTNFTMVSNSSSSSSSSSSNNHTTNDTEPLVVNSITKPISTNNTNGTVTNAVTASAKLETKTAEVAPTDVISAAESVAKTVEFTKADGTTEEVSEDTVSSITIPGVTVGGLPVSASSFDDAKDQADTYLGTNTKTYADLKAKFNGKKVVVTDKDGNEIEITLNLQ